VTDDPGEKLFERYIEQRGYTVLDHRPDLSTAKRPDYLVRADGTDVVVEVESFKTTVVQAPTEPSGSAAVGDLRPVRNKISTGAEQLKGISGRPLIVTPPARWASWVVKASLGVVPGSRRCKRPCMAMRDQLDADLAHLFRLHGGCRASVAASW
jgi:hypothetical protein